MFLSVTDAIWELVETFYDEKFEIIAPYYLCYFGKLNLKQHLTLDLL